MNQDTSYYLYIQSRWAWQSEMAVSLRVIYLVAYWLIYSCHFYAPPLGLKTKPTKNNVNYNSMVQQKQKKLAASFKCFFFLESVLNFSVDSSQASNGTHIYKCTLFLRNDINHWVNLTIDWKVPNWLERLKSSRLVCIPQFWTMLHVKAN